MQDSPIKQLCDVVEEAHERIQADFKEINPVVGVNKKMRTIGIATDFMTIDCLKSGKRILFVLHDAQPEIAQYQFCRRDEDPRDEFESIALESLTVQQLYDWMKRTFSARD